LAEVMIELAMMCAPWTMFRGPQNRSKKPG